ncbi:GerA spore germination protein [Thermincola ferriacetica]|uniref:GerA spore germination protein n=1 Tax=Thermincola ferriacetica TaxID=281456 RepID=A0A0L6W384_9FIRM|nr:spore germination protein [Thermincola ferriacetica]KNZ69544.1 GerA spore germination protein [Thermincola ferriacetica]
MLKKWKRILKRIFAKPAPEKSISYDKLEKVSLSANLEENISYLRAAFDRCSDFVLREFVVGTTPSVKAAMAYIDGLVNKKMLTDDMVKTFMYDAVQLKNKGPALQNKDVFAEELLAFTEVKTSNNMKDLLAAVLTGETVLLVDGLDNYFAVSTQNWVQRAVTEPETESVVRGPKEGFTESLQTNITLIRRRIKSPRLKFETIKIGTLTNTAVCISYIDGVVNEKIVAEVKERLKRIKVDGILESGYIEEFIEDAPLSIFPTVNSTERPDKVAGGLLEGQVAILVDTTPFVLLLPVTFPQMLQASEDYYLRWPFATFIRLIRFGALNSALLLPAFYIAIVTYHQEMLPTPLLISIAAAREGVPFPAFVEAILMEGTFEVLREAGVRLPKTIGQAVSIVGALVIGEAAVTAGLVSPAMVIVVALTAIASFTLPSYSGSFSIRILRFTLMVLAAFLGLFGIMTGLLAILIHLCALRSFGIPYISPLAPTSLRDLKDMFFRAPWWSMFVRPRTYGYKDAARQKYGQKPKAPEERKRNENNENRISRKIARRKPQ